MTSLSLRESVNKVMGLDRCVFMTQFFNDGSPDIFLIVNNDVDGTYHLFYEEGNGKISVFKIGTARTFKRFLCGAYKVNPTINYSNDYWGALLRSQHVEAKQRAIASVRNWIAAELAAEAADKERN